jgi:hypothetical protein
MLAFSLIAREGGEALLRRLLDTSPSSLWSSDAQGNTLLHQALLCGRFDLAGELVQRGLDPCATNAAGQRPVDVVAGAHPLLFAGSSSPPCGWGETGLRSLQISTPLASDPGHRSCGVGNPNAQTVAAGVGSAARSCSTSISNTGSGHGQCSGASRGEEEVLALSLSSHGQCCSGASASDEEVLALTLSTLSDDAAVEISKHLKLADVLSLSETSRHFHQLRDSPALWEHLCWVHLKKTLGERQSCLVSYRDVYIEHAILQGGVKLIAKQREEAKGRGEHMRRHMSSSIEELFSH